MSDLGASLKRFREHLDRNNIDPDDLLDDPEGLEEALVVFVNFNPDIGLDTFDAMLEHIGSHEWQEPK